MRRVRWLAWLAVVAVGPLQAAEVGPLVARIKAVGREGAGNADAARAWRELAQAPASALPDLLAGFDGADARAANWLRAAVDAVAERELAAGRPLPSGRLEAFVKDTQHAPRARRTAYEWLVRVDPKAPERLLPGLLNDPSTELRRDAVAALLNDAEQLQKKDDKSAATAAYRKALSAARDKDQVDLIAKQLKSLGVEVDLATHFGFIQRWQLAAVFDNADGKGFEAVYPPEKGVDLAARYQGKKGQEVTWTEHVTKDPYGVVDLNKVVGKHMGVVAYAFAAVVSPTEQPVELRAGTTNAVRIFLNGKEVFFREEYHHGMTMDQHVGRGNLKPGRNEILIKVCQNEQTEEWAQNWSFQLRLCDAVGGAVPFTVATEGRGK